MRPAPDASPMGRVRGMLPALLEESAAKSRRRGTRRRLAVGSLAAAAALALGACGGGERQDADEPEGDFPVEIAAAEFPTAQRLAQTSDLVLTVRNTGDETIPDLAVTVFTSRDTTEELSDDEASSVEDEGADETATDAEGEEIPEEELGSAVDQALEEELQNEEETEAEDTEAPEHLPEAEGAFSVISEQEGLAIPSRPVWILEMGYPRLAGTEPGTPPPGELSGAGGAEAAQTNTFSFGELEPDESAEMVWQVTPVQAGTYTVRYRVAAGLQGKARAVTADGSLPEGEFVVQISDEPPQTRVDDSGRVVPIKPGDILGQAGSDEQKQELGGSSTP